MTRLFLIGLLGLVLGAGCGGSEGDPTRDPSLGGSGGDGGAGGAGGSGSPGAQCWEELAPSGDVGGACRENDICNTSKGLVCIPEQTIGGPDDPIMNHPPGENVPLEDPVWADGYCTFPTDCDPVACEAECGLCNQGLCMRACFPEADTKSSCRDGYQCDLLGLVCTPGCFSDDDCRVFLENDQWVYDTESKAVCDLETHRCGHPGTDGREAGDPCLRDEDCEANGVCLDEASTELPGGYCSKIACDIEGIDCAGDGVCALIDGLPLCFASCTVGTGATEGDPSTYLNNTQGCRDGYTCLWGRSPGDPTGICDVGVFNDVTTNNIGAACADDAECYSPFGYGLCGGEGFGCTVLDCDVPGIPSDICGDDASCRSDGLGSLCLKNCSAAEECLEGAACADWDENPDTPDDVCFPTCIASSECRQGEVCDINGQCTAP